MPYLVESVNSKAGRSVRNATMMHDCKVTAEMASVIKKARRLKIPYSWITGYYPGLNFGRIADVMKGRLYPDVTPAKRLPPDFPAMA